jgi:hypothetical protein
MKKLLASILTLFVLTGSAFAFTPDNWMGYSATKTADALIHTGAGWFYGFTCLTDGTNAVTFKVYDNTSGTGTRIGNDFICVTSSTNRTCVFGTGYAIPFDTGLYIDITSSDATPDYTIFYRGK